MKPTILIADDDLAVQNVIESVLTNQGYTLAFAEIEVEQIGFVRPEIRLYGKTLETYNRVNPGKISLSLSHLKSIATAIVIIEQA